ncbi:MAG: c-type cytochrome [Gammaproteobacteria bacterium]|nr:c-type cytochrome [Gammaproteobacteria bacterium]
MRNFPIVIIAITGLAGCSDEDGQGARHQQAQAEQVQVVRHQDSAQILRGHKLFLQNCAVCHGIKAEGAPNWSRPDANGKYPAPPLNGSGHAWHHPQQALIATIKHGTARLGGSMPAWKDRLSDQDINDIIAWFQSQWPDELYAAWQRMDQASQQSRR